jgi:hydroxymethylglutaryl-CoA lyase
MGGDFIEIVEVGGRDGLQNEAVTVATSDKIDLIGRVAAAGVPRIEVASFVHPKLVPQMADAEAVLEGLPTADSGYIGLVLNRRGLERALATSIHEINFVVSASEAFNEANQRATIAETMGEIEAMVPEAAAAGMKTTVTVAVAFGCPFEGEVAASSVVTLVERSVAAGADEVALGDTIGVASPHDVAGRVGLLSEVLATTPLRCHFHDTRNTGIANVVAAVEAGVKVIDASVGGTGGCPYAPNATGNVPTEDVLYTLHRMGFATGIDIEAMIATGHWLATKLGKQLPSALGRAGPWPA